ncbi:MAG: DUF3341 domain-containing protein [Deltaproteobacteria bacterium]|nr:DUF3341 domain-containing protein [Kofleriaceae bacterium]
MKRMLAELRGPAELVAAVAELRARGYTAIDAYTPFPVHGLDEALDARPSRLPVAVLVAGLLAASGAYFLQWLVADHLYPLDVGNRPNHFPLGFVPITFEMGVLFAGITAVAAVLVLGRLVRLWHPVFDADGFESATATRFWLELRAGDPRFDGIRTADELRALGALRVVTVDPEGRS